MKKFIEIDGLDIELCLGSGQFFHWEKLSQGFGLVNGDKAWYIRQEGNKYRLEGGSKEEIEDFFNSQTSYRRVFDDLARAGLPQEMLEATRGLRLLKQDPWEAIVAFILSTNNNVSRIHKSIQALGREFGQEIAEFDGDKFYSLPQPQVLAQLDPQILRQRAGTGYRDKYLVESAQMICQKDLDLEKIPSLTYEEALKEIMKLSGVGKKAGDCILLFGFGFSESFPVDVWIERIMQDLYGPFQSRSEISDFGRKKFASEAGFVQQIFFHYARTKGLGQKGK